MLKFCCFCSLFMAFFAVAHAARLQPDYRTDYIAYEEEMPYEPSRTADIMSKFGLLSPQQLLDTADYYEIHNIIDTPLICYNLIINAPVKEDDPGQQQLKIRVLNKSAVIYFWMCDYLKSYELLIKALDLCEKYPNGSIEFRIHANIGNIYYRFKEYDLAKLYYSRALELCRDSTNVILLYDNIGQAEFEKGELDSAFYHLDKALQINSRFGNIHINSLSNTIASIYQKRGLYDSAFYYLRLALDDARKNRREEFEAENLSDLGKLFFETERADSAILYIGYSNAVARENKFYNILLENHLTLSKIEKAKGYYDKSLEEMEKYSNLKDSIFSASRLMDINNLQRIYEVSKTNRQLEELAVEQKIKERTISYQRTGLFAAIAALLLVVVILLFVFSQKRRLNKAYKALFEKNLEIISLQERTSDKHPKNMPHSKHTLLHVCQFYNVAVFFRNSRGSKRSIHRTFCK